MCERDHERERERVRECTCGCTRAGGGCWCRRGVVDAADQRRMASLSRFLPLFDRVLVERLAKQSKSAGGILLPESATAKVSRIKAPAHTSTETYRRFHLCLDDD